MYGGVSPNQVITLFSSFPLPSLQMVVYARVMYTGLRDMRSWSSLLCIRGYLLLRYNLYLTSLRGFERLTSIGTDAPLDAQVFLSDLTNPDLKTPGGFAPLARAAGCPGSNYPPDPHPIILGLPPDCGSGASITSFARLCSWIAANTTCPP